MKLSGHTYLLGRSLSMLGSIASRVVNSPSAARVVNRVHAKWDTESVTLTATDGHRALTITLASAGLHAAQAEAVFQMGADGWSEGQALHTIFRAPDGDVKVFGDAGGWNLGHVVDANYPSEAIVEIREDILAGSGAVGAMEINPVYVAEGLAMINGLWALVQHPAFPERVTMTIPDHKHAPMMFTSQFPEKQPLFRIEYILMPYRTP